MSPDHDPRPLNFDYPARDCPMCGEDLPCACSAVQMFGEDYDVQSRHFHREFTVEPGAVEWAAWIECAPVPDSPDGAKDGQQVRRNRRKHQEG